MPNQTEKRKRDTSSSQAQKRVQAWWRNLKVGERAAVIGLVGTLLAAVCGASCGGLFTLAEGAISDLVQAPRADLPPSSLEGSLEAFRVASVRFGDLQPRLTGIPSDGNCAKLWFAGDWDSISGCLESEGYEVLYEHGDFSALTLPQGVVLPLSTVDPNEPFAFGALYIEVWNLSAEYPIILDQISLELLSYQPPTSSTLELYFPVLPGMGSDPCADMNCLQLESSLAASNKTRALFQDPSQRIRIEPKDCVLSIINIAFIDPGQYRFRPSIQYHMPDGSSATLGLEEIIYRWARVAFVDGSQVHVLNVP